jgi:hypothetical protein
MQNEKHYEGHRDESSRGDNYQLRKVREKPWEKGRDGFQVFP